MKKLIKIMAIIFVCTAIVQVGGARAATGYVGFADIDIPYFQLPYNGPTAEKTVEGPQYAVKSSAIDAISGNERAVEAQVCEGAACTAWLKLPKGQIKSWGNTKIYKGAYRIRIRNSNPDVPTGSRFWGSWRLDYKGV